MMALLPIMDRIVRRNPLRRFSANTRLKPHLSEMGLPAFKTFDGIIVYLKGAETIEADATGLPSEIGVYHQARGALADQIAIRVIWPDT